MSDKKTPHLHKVTWDEEAKAIYIAVREGEIYRTLPCQKLDFSINVDVNEQGELIGVEILL